MPSNKEENAALDKNFLIVQIACERVEKRGGNTMNQVELKAALSEVEAQLKEMH